MSPKLKLNTLSPVQKLQIQEEIIISSHRILLPVWLLLLLSQGKNLCEELQHSILKLQYILISLLLNLNHAIPYVKAKQYRYENQTSNNIYSK